MTLSNAMDVFYMACAGKRHGSTLLNRWQIGETNREELMMQRKTIGAEQVGNLMRMMLVQPKIENTIL